MRAFILALTVVISPFVFADWQVESSYSRVSFVTVKRGNMADVQFFSTVTGVIDQHGSARLALPYESLDNTLALQTERMRETLFKADQYPEAVITSQIDLPTWEQMPVGSIRQEKLDFELEINGQKQRLKADVSVTRIGETLVQVSTLQPVLIKAIDFSLLEGLDKLKEIASVPSITPEVPVSVLLTLRHVPTPT